MRAEPVRYPPGVTPLHLSGGQDVRAQADWDGVEIAMGRSQRPLKLTSVQAYELGEWLLAAARAIDREG